MMNWVAALCYAFQRMSIHTNLAKRLSVTTHFYARLKCARRAILKLATVENDGMHGDLAMLAGN